MTHYVKGTRSGAFPGTISLGHPLKEKGKEDERSNVFLLPPNSCSR